MKGRTDVRTYVRTDVDDAMAIKPNFLTSMGYHIFLTMVLRAIRTELVFCFVIVISYFEYRYGKTLICRPDV